MSGEGDAGYGGVLNLVWGADLDDFCFGAIELKKIESHPRLDLLQSTVCILHVQIKSDPKKTPTLKFP